MKPMAKKERRMYEREYIQDVTTGKKGGEGDTSGQKTRERTCTNKDHHVLNRRRCVALGPVQKPSNRAKIRSHQKLMCGIRLVCTGPPSWRKPESSWLVKKLQSRDKRRGLKGK